MRLLLAIAILLCSSAAQANTSIDMFKAADLVVRGEYDNAIEAYSDILDDNPNYAEAYIQRAIVYKGLGRAERAKHDAQTAMNIIRGTLMQTPNNAKALYQRSQALRLLERFDEAERDVRRAIQLSGKKRWQQDLQTIAMERRIAQSANQ